MALQQANVWRARCFWVGVTAAVAAAAPEGCTWKDCLAGQISCQGCTGTEDIPGEGVVA